MTVLHCSIDIKDALTWSDEKIGGMLSNKVDGRVLSVDEIKDFLILELRAGRTYFCACDNRKQDGSCAWHPSKGVERGLVVSPKWAELIVSGKKTWEMRSTRTSIRGRIAIIAAGTGTIVGEVDLLGVGRRITKADYYRYSEHCIAPDDDVDASRYPTPWLLGNAEKYIEPIPYNHPQGAVVWVRLETE